MPIYTYKCVSCNHIQDEIHKIAELNTYQFKCEECGFDSGERQLTTPAMVYNTADQNVFKGGLLTSLDTLNGRSRRSKKVYSGFPVDSTPK
jgi:putative FmdB family regulatory protein